MYIYINRQIHTEVISNFTRTTIQKAVLDAELSLAKAKNSLDIHSYKQTP